MESRHRRLLLSAALAFAGVPVAASAAESLGTLQAGSLEPAIARTDTAEPSVPDRSLEAGVYLGQLATEDFGTNLSSGLSLTWHASEDNFYELDIGRSGLQRTSAERLGTDAVLDLGGGHAMTYTHLSVGWNLLPGEFRWNGRSLPTTGYLVAGGGNTQVFGNTEFTFNVGAGLRMIVSDTILLHLDAREYIYDSDVLITNRTYNDLELRAGLTTLF